MVREKLNCSFEINFLRVECWSEEIAWCTVALFEVLSKNEAEGTSHGHWVEQSDAESVVVDPPSQLVTEYLQKYKLHGLSVNEKRLYPFSRAGWFERARFWAEKKLNDYGYEVQTIEKLQHGSGS
ncbi:hypothetical protein FGB62_203g01 [Gracilaria domingensis]|nr:hypothetical protein FGB62_203g01 [Gracilaria domingensis]